MKDESLSSERKFVSDPRELEVYKRAFRVSIDIHKATLHFPKIEQFAMADQLRQASKSVTANIAEGFGKQNYSKAEFIRFLAMSEGSATEVQVWLHYAYSLDYISLENFKTWDEEYRVLKSMLYRLRKNIC